jgi:ferredoxin
MNIGTEVSRLSLPREDLGKLVEALCTDGWRIVAPVVDEGAVVYDEIRQAQELPRGYVDEQKPGSYRLVKTDSGRWFDHTVGPHSPKRHLLPAQSIMWTVERQDGSPRFVDPEAPPKTAFFGIRSCEVAAIAIQTGVLSVAPRDDDQFRERRARLFIVAVQCTRASGNCFCGAMGSGPLCGDGADVVLTEGAHEFLVEPRSEAGRNVVDRLNLWPATTALEEECQTAVHATSNATGQRFTSAGVPELLLSSIENRHWEDVAHRCLACGNCTLVCPTCSCTDVRDHSSLDGQSACRERVWDVCFTPEFTYLFGGAFRKKISARYRHWVTHKFAYWHAQFGRSGCTGCGRCITWCPVGIDVTAEINALRETGAQ